MALSRTTLLRFREGDGQAFGEVVRAYGPLIRGIAARHFRHEFFREEAVQEIWTHAFRNREALDLDRLEAFSGWLGTVAHRRCVDLLRRAEGPDSAPEGAVDPAELEVPPSQEKTSAERELEQAADAFATRLRPAWRDFFQLHFVEGLPYEDIASRLGISRLRCKYMKKVLAARARRDARLLEALGRCVDSGGRDAR